MLKKILVVLVNTLSEWLLAYMSSASAWVVRPRPPPGLCPWTPLGDFCPSPPVLSFSETNFWLRPCMALRHGTRLEGRRYVYAIWACGFSLPALANNWICGTACRHTTASINHTRPSPVAHKLLLISRPDEGRGLSWLENTVG